MLYSGAAIAPAVGAVAPIAAPAAVATGFFGNIFGGKGASSMVMQGAQVLGAIGSYNNQRQQMENLRNEAAWNRYYADQDKQQKAMLARRKASKLLSERRAMMGMRGVRMATGSTLLELNSTLDDLEEELFWIEKGAAREAQKIDMKARGQYARLKGAQTQSLMTSAYNIGQTWKTT
jgi:hypothetical protein